MTLLTARQALDAGDIQELVRLIDAGARAKLDDPDTLIAPLWNQARATAEALVRRGTPMDLRFGGTPAEWAERGRPEDLPAMLALLST